jgi:hypothetical protein
MTRPSIYSALVTPAAVAGAVLTVGFAWHGRWFLATWCAAGTWCAVTVARRVW